MKALAQRKTRLVFETADTVFDAGQLRPVIVEPRPGCMTLRLKGTRRSYVMTYAAVYTAAVWRADEEKRKAKAAERKAGRRAARR
jgi:hypothetical protein